MITSKAVLSAIADRWDQKGLFASRWPNIVGNWCVKHYRKYRKAPGSQIESIYDQWAEGREGKDNENVKLISKFLSSLSGQYSRERKKVQSQYIIDLAAEHFNSVKADDTCDEVKGLIEDGRITEALAAMEKFKKVEMGAGRRISVLRDKKAIFKAFKAKGDPVVKFDGPNDGALKEFFEDALLRDSFILFEGPEKRGKSWILIEMAWRAMLQGRKVAMFQTGDLSEDQIMRRFMIRAAGRPLNATKKGKPILLPVGLSSPREEGGVAHVVHKKIKYNDSLTAKESWRGARRITKRWNEDLLMLECYPNSSISINGIAGVLESWKRMDGWVPDLIVIDYADILAPIDGKVDTRFQIDATHRGMRRLSQEFHCLLLSATQTNKESYDVNTIGMKHVAESKTKLAHANGIVAINRSEEEKKLGLYRFNWVAGREWDYSTDTCVHTAGSLALASPMMFSTF